MNDHFKHNYNDSWYSKAECMYVFIYVYICIHKIIAFQSWILKWWFFSKIDFDMIFSINNFSCLSDFLSFALMNVVIVVVAIDEINQDSIGLGLPDKSYAMKSMFFI